MKAFFGIVLLLVSLTTNAQKVSLSLAYETAHGFFVQCNQPTGTLVQADILVHSDDTLAFIFTNSQSSWVVVAANQSVRPVQAFSFLSEYRIEPAFSRMIVSSLHQQLAGSQNLLPHQKALIQNEWISLKESTSGSPKVQQWPADGTTSTGGWIETHWTQSAPYNQFCPLDPVTGQRSYTGCPATAMAQIINYLKTTQGTRFDDGDDYYHNYAGRQYHIDDDFAANGFLSFPDLNTWLDSCDALFAQGMDASGATAAALTFACGTACVQVYTSQGSGTFSVNQAFDAYGRFGFLSAALHTNTDSVMYYSLIQNMKNAYPAHLAVVDSAWSVGHNVVVDGYRSDGYFHINFGWGGSNDGWWLIPDPSFPYAMGVLEGIVLDIIPVSAGLNDDLSSSTLNIWPNPAQEKLFISPQQVLGHSYSIYSTDGRILLHGTANKSIDISALPAGCYLLTIKGDNGLLSRQFLKQ